ncbi:MAG: Alpha-L-arabinofuranosidase [Bacteroidales bacterium]
MESATLPVNKGLYGLSMEQTDFSGEGKFYAELLHNCSFNEGGDIPGWRPLSSATYLALSNTRPVSEANPLSLMVSVYSSVERGGAVAAGKGKGFAIRKGEKYNLSFYLRTASSLEEFVPVRVALENEQASLRLSNQYEVTPSPQWTRCAYTFTATESAGHATLTFTTNRPFFFWLDSVSLVPAQTWNNRSNGFKPDLMEKIQALTPAFLHYLGNREGAAFNDFLLMCKDLQTEALYGREQGTAFHSGKAFLIADHPFFHSADYPAANSGLSVYGFSAAGEEIKGTHAAAVAEACFMLHAENNPYAIDRLAYTPVISGKDTSDPRSALMILHNDSLTLSPSYYIWQLLSRNRGDVVLKTEINTYLKPQVMPGQPEMRTSDVVLPPLPSLVATATYSKADRTILLKVANPTLHYEIAGLNIHGASIKNKAEVMQLKGLPSREVAARESRQSLPVNETFSFPAGRAKVYKFPPQSVTVLKLKVK